MRKGALMNKYIFIVLSYCLISPLFGMEDYVSFLTKRAILNDAIDRYDVEEVRKIFIKNGFEDDHLSPYLKKVENNIRDENYRNCGELRSISNLQEKEKKEREYYARALEIKGLIEKKMQSLEAHQK